MSLGFRYDFASMPWIAALLVVFGLILLATYALTPTTVLRRLGLGVLKAGAITLLAFCLLNPTQTLRKGVPGENLLLFAVDESLSMDSADTQAGRTFRDVVRSRFQDSTRWLDDLEAEFQVRYYTLGDQLRSTEREQLGSDSNPPAQSRLVSQLTQLINRHAGRPVAGIVVVTDGRSTDAFPTQSPDDSIPIYPVILKNERPPLDLSIADIHAQPTQFETAPLRISVSLRHTGFNGSVARVGVLDEAGVWLTTRTVGLSESGRANLNLEVEQFAGDLARYRVVTRLEDEWLETGEVSELAQTREATLLNNQQRLLVPRQGGPFRMLYVSGRPNWDFKFLRRAAQDDPEIQLVGLLRLALKEPRFAFLDSQDRRNPLFQGSASDEEQVEQYDEPVVIRIGTLDETELRDGFPNSAAELFTYSAIILDDIDTEYFKQDQLDLLREFVDRRGGGLLMLGGPEGFDGGKFQRTTFAELLPIYPRTSATGVGKPLRWDLSREGWLAPWTRLRDTETGEQEARAAIPTFLSVNRIDQIKPGASLMSVLTSQQGEQLPALVTQSYGRGRTAALMIGDLFRWRLRSPTPPSSPMNRQGVVANSKTAGEFDDFGQNWRQLLRWLVADLPRRLELQVQDTSAELPQRSLLISVRDKEFLPEDGAQVTVTIKFPDGSELQQSAQPTVTQGQYRTDITLDSQGYYEVACEASDPDGSVIDTARTGWAWEPITDELREITPETQPWEQWAQTSEGKSLEDSQLPRLNRLLNYDKVSKTLIEEQPIWHRWGVFLAAITLLGLEWGWRRWLGLA